MDRNCIVILQCLVVRQTCHLSYTCVSDDMSQSYSCVMMIIIIIYRVSSYYSRRLLPPGDIDDAEKSLGFTLNLVVNVIICDQSLTFCHVTNGNQSKPSGLSSKQVTWCPSRRIAFLFSSGQLLISDPCMIRRLDRESVVTRG